MAPQPRSAPDCGAVCPAGDRRLRQRTQLRIGKQAAPAGAARAEGTLEPLPARAG